MGGGRLLVERIDSVFGEYALSGHLLFIDDGSLESLPDQFPETPPRNIQQIQSVELRTNLGHQRALCVGLVHLAQSELAGPVVIMDADGEDAPSDITRLLEKFVGEDKRKVIFAARGLRAEGFLFKFFYKLYRTIHRLAVGFDPRFGNFSVLPASILERLVVSSDLWNHYAAAVVKMKLPYATVPIDRSRRFVGESKMGFVGLVVHGLSAMSVFGDTVGVRLLILCGFSGASDHRFYNRRIDSQIDHGPRHSRMGYIRNRIAAVDPFSTGRALPGLYFCGSIQSWTIQLHADPRLPNLYRQSANSLHQT